jgi:hypothetical protein
MFDYCVTTRWVWNWLILNEKDQVDSIQKVCSVTVEKDELANLWICDFSIDELSNPFSERDSDGWSDVWQLILSECESKVEARFVWID